MATRTWTSSGDGNFGTAGNWSGGVAPTATDNIVFDGTSVVDVTSGLDQTATGTWGVGTTFTVTKDYTGNIASSGGSLLMNFNGVLRMESGGDEFWFDNRSATGILRCIASPRTLGANACQLDGDIIDLYVTSGRVTLNAAMAFDSGGRVVVDNDETGTSPILVCQSGGTVTGTALFQRAGEVQSSVAWPAVYLGGGRFVHDAGTITELFASGGEYIADVGTVTDLYAFGPNTRLDGAANDGWTITTLHIGMGAYADFRNTLGTTPGTIRPFGPSRIDYPMGS